MTTETLYRKFNEALVWNGALYFFSTASKFLVSLLLYRTLTTQDFAIWANLLSIVFLLALWLDFGFSRSLPQYAPQFAKCPHAKRRFLRNIFMFKGAITALVATTLVFTTHLPYIYLGAALLCIESMKATTRLLYHSYFKHKVFNKLESGIITLRLVAIALLCIKGYSLGSIFAIEVATSLALTLYTLLTLKVPHDYTGNLPKGLGRSFARHSAAIWSINTASSFSERNFLVPLCTLLFGAAGGALFKVANDGALLFSRFVLKTIGTTGTSLLSHMTSQVQLDMLNQRIRQLTLPLIAIVLLSAMVFALMPWTSSLLFQTFFVLALGYLTQLLFMGYDRLLEVTHSYKPLFVSLLPYVLIMGLFAISSQVQLALAALPAYVLCIQALRLTSTYIRVRAARTLRLE